ncbi:hypothetical protein MNEG_5874, partial [Monoraphidium neglectum]
VLPALLMQQCQCGWHGREPLGHWQLPGHQPGLRLRLRVQVNRPQAGVPAERCRCHRGPAVPPV